MNVLTMEEASAAAVDDAARTAIYRRISWKLLPFLFFCFFAAYLDRVNVSFAKLQMAKDIGLSAYVYGLGAGIFFIGYAVFEVPSNLILHKVGARRWIARIMLSWAVISALFAFVQTPLQFYILRFMLGVAEAGFAPGALLYITYWFPAARRARAMSIFFIAIPISGILGAPLSGAILELFSGVAHLPGWRWLFLLEAVPAFAAGVLCLRLLPDNPAAVSWLSGSEKAIIASDLGADAAVKHEHASIKQFIGDKRLWLLCGLYFCIVMGQYAISFWLPTIVHDAGITDPLMNGLITAIPFLATVVSMLCLARSADVRRERRFHLILPMAVGAVALTLASFTRGDLPLSVVLLSLAASGLLSSTAQFWAIPPAFLGGIWAAAGMGAINAIGNIAGFASPFAIGSIVSLTGSLPAGLYAITGIEILGILLVLLIPARQVNR